MTALQVKDCPEEVYERLKQCAARENRSISQQTITILEEYLGMRPQTKHSESRLKMVSEDRPSQYGKPIDYIEKRRRIFEKLDKLKPIPITKDCPRADEILRQIREEEAR